MKQADTEIIAKLNQIFDAQAAGGGASFASLTGSPEDNAALASSLDAKQSEAEVQTIADAKVESEAYGPTWDGDTTHAPSKNDVYDKIEDVVASIPAAPSGGVIGTAVLVIGGGEVVTVDFANGVLTETTEATFTYADGTGRLTVAFVNPQVDAFYQPNITVEGTGPLFTRVRDSLDANGFQFAITKFDGTTPVSGTDVTRARITVSRLSQ